MPNLNGPQQLNLYSRVRNNPLNITDSSGLDCDDFDCGGLDFPTFGISIGFGGGWDSARNGPQPPSYTPPNVATSPNPPNGSLPRWRVSASATLSRGWPRGAHSARWGHIIWGEVSSAGAKTRRAGN
jgi:hypothetical protein